jgi:signal transduction histidine kinase
MGAVADVGYESRRAGEMPVSIATGRDTCKLPDAAPFASFICHDLRHPLAAILAYSEILAEHQLNPSQRKDFHLEIQQAVSRMDDLIGQLLECSRGNDNLRPQLADIAGTVTQAIQVARARPEFGRIVVSYRHQGPTTGWFDPGKLQRAITNLVLNACEAVSPTSGRIEVSSLVHAERAELRVADNGPGIPDFVSRSLFQPFVSCGKKTGTGIGLAIAHKILRDHGGDMFLVSTGEKGTEFRLVLPLGCHGRS